MDHLDELENRSIFIIREAYKRFKRIGLLWSIGKDSTTLVWLARKAFYGKLPFPVIHIDTGHKFPEMYEFRTKWVDKWGLNLIVGKNEEAIKRGVICKPGDTHACSTELKTKALQMTIAQHKLKAVIVGIRRDEHGIRAKERHFSPRNEDFKWDYKNQPPELWEQFKAQITEKEHLRIHPLLGWTELNIWEYIQREGIPVNELYFAKNGKRFRSLGCQPTTRPIDSDADTIEKIVEELKTTKQAERAGRALDKESMYEMQKLRALGYM
jgi:sulfate adenylyltransferase subunit 2